MIRKHLAFSLKIRSANPDRGPNRCRASTLDLQARLYKKAPGTGAVQCFRGHALMENLHGLVVQADLTQTEGYAGHIASPFAWIDPNPHAGG
tara:strand:+ start:2370 stop:2645 length:276 start_codon:yes stop_codon:yes gene_type:complete